MTGRHQNGQDQDEWRKMVFQSALSRRLLHEAPTNRYMLLNGTNMYYTEETPRDRRRLSYVYHAV